MQIVDEGISIAVNIVMIFVGIYGFIAVGIIIYGIISVIGQSTRVYEDNDSSYGYYSQLLYNHRTIPRSSKGVHGEPAMLVGWVYILVGLLMLVPLIWVYIKFR